MANWTPEHIEELRAAMDEILPLSIDTRSYTDRTISRLTRPAVTFTCPHCGSTNTTRHEEMTTTQYVDMEFDHMVMVDGCIDCGEQWLSGELEADRDASLMNAIYKKLAADADFWEKEMLAALDERDKGRKRIAELEKQRDAALAALGIVAKEIGAEPSLERLSDVIAAHMQHIRDMEAK